MPFSDDLRLPQVYELPGRLLLLAVFAPPERFRIEYLNAAIRVPSATGKFLDELPPSTEFAFLRAQASATLEATAPTLLRLTDSFGDSFSRLLLPMWGNGQVNMLLGAL